jgi:hypothetical protein
MARKVPDPNAPRPTGAGLRLRHYCVINRPEEGVQTKIWDKDLTYDEAWKVKEGIIGARKSTTARVALMPQYAAKQSRAARPQPTFSDQQRVQAAAAAARAATPVYETPPAAEYAPPIPAIPVIDVAGESIGATDDEIAALLGDAHASGGSNGAIDMSDGDLDRMIDEHDAGDVLKSS